MGSAVDRSPGPGNKWGLRADGDALHLAPPLGPLLCRALRAHACVRSRSRPRRPAARHRRARRAAARRPPDHGRRDVPGRARRGRRRADVVDRRRAEPRPGPGARLPGAGQPRRRPLGRRARGGRPRGRAHAEAAAADARAAPARRATRGPPPPRRRARQGAGPRRPLGAPCVVRRARRHFRRALDRPSARVDARHRRSGRAPGAAHRPVHALALPGRQRPRPPAPGLGPARARRALDPPRGAGGGAEPPPGARRLARRRGGGRRMAPRPRARAPDRPGARRGSGRGARRRRWPLRVDRGRLLARPRRPG